MKKNSNSRIFRIVLDRLCEIEANWKAPIAKVDGPVIIGVRATDLPHIWEQATSAKCLPYRKLRRLLNLERNLEQDIEGYGGEGNAAVNALDTIPIVSGFSVNQIIDGCAQALRFADTTNRFRVQRNNYRDYRNMHLLMKNPERVQQRTIEMIKVALAANPTVSLAGKVVSLAVTNGSTSTVTELSRAYIKQHKVGCMYYQSDRLNNNIPTPATLLAFNLEWIFRHWPLNKETFPTWPQRKQIRGNIIDQRLYKPRRDIVARFLNAIFPSNYTYDDETLNFNLRFPPNAKFCGW